MHPRPALCGNEADARLNGPHSWKKKKKKSPLSPSAFLPSTLCNMLTVCGREPETRLWANGNSWHLLTKPGNLEPVTHGGDGDLAQTRGLKNRKRTDGRDGTVVVSQTCLSCLTLKAKTDLFDTVLT